MPGRIVSLDLGTTTGFARRSGRGDRVYFSHRKWREPKDAEAVLYRRFQCWLAGISRGKTKPGLIVFEEVKRHMSNRAAMVYGGLRGVLLAACAEHEIHARPIGVTELKKWATGRGNAPKNEMIQEAAERVSHEPGAVRPTHDEADAILLLLFAEEQGW